MDGFFGNTIGSLRDTVFNTIMGTEAPLAPSCVRASEITGNSAVISWLPSDNTYHHVVYVNNIHVKTLQPGICRHVVMGLSPSTTYHVTITSKNLTTLSPAISLTFDDHTGSSSSQTRFTTLSSSAAPAPPIHPAQVNNNNNNNNNAGQQWQQFGPAHNQYGDLRYSGSYHQGFQDYPSAAPPRGYYNQNYPPMDSHHPPNYQRGGVGGTRGGRRIPDWPPTARDYYYHHHPPPYHHHNQQAGYEMDPAYNNNYNMTGGGGGYGQRRRQLPMPPVRHGILITSRSFDYGGESTFPDPYGGWGEQTPLLQAEHTQMEDTSAVVGGGVLDPNVLTKKMIAMCDYNPNELLEKLPEIPEIVELPPEEEEQVAATTEEKGAEETATEQPADATVEAAAAAEAPAAAAASDKPAEEAIKPFTVPSLPSAADWLQMPTIPDTVMDVDISFINQFKTTIMEHAPTIPIPEMPKMPEIPIPGKEAAAAAAAETTGEQAATAVASAEKAQVDAKPKEQELTVAKGDIITVYGEVNKDGFYLGELNGVRGLVPASILKELPPEGVTAEITEALVVPVSTEEKSAPAEAAEKPAPPPPVVVEDTGPPPPKKDGPRRFYPGDGRDEPKLAAGAVMSMEEDIAQRKRKKAARGSNVEKPKTSLCCLGLNNPIRRLAYALIEWKGFEAIILTTILLTCVSLALSTPYPNDDNDGLNEQIESYEIVFTVIFTAECFLKIIAQGLYFHDGAYLKGGVWNWLDFVVVAIGLLEPIISSIIKGFDPKALRAFRVLRPLKLVGGVPALQIVMNAILMALIPLLNIAVLVVFIMCIYAIIGLEMYEGALHQTCFNNDTGEMMKDPVNCGGGYNCEDMGEPWVCRHHWDGPFDGILNFDNIGLAMLTVYQCIALEGWVDLMYHLQDALGTGSEWFYFITLVVFGAFFVMNLVLGVLSGEFGKQKEKSESRGEFLKQREQQQVDSAMSKYLDWITTAGRNIPEFIAAEEAAKREAEEAAQEKELTTNDKIRLAIENVIKTEWFYWTVILLVFLNTMVLATEHYRQPIWLEEFQGFVNVFFVVLFFFELLLKMYCLGLSRYFVSLFNRFEFFATLGSIAEVILVNKGLMPPLGMSVMRCVRLLRCFKVTHYWKAMKLLAEGIVNSLMSIAALLLLLFLFMMIFGLLGMQMFGGKFNSITPGEYKARTHFDSFSQSMLTVFEVINGGFDVMNLCINASGGISKFPLVALGYFLVLFTFGNYIMLNVFLAIAVDNLELAEDEVEVEKEEGGEPPPSEVEGGEPAPAEKPAEKKDVEVAAAAAEEAPAAEEEAEPPPEPPNPPIPEGRSFFILSQTNFIRTFFYAVINNSVVGNVLLVCILISSASMAAEDPVYENSPRNQMLEKADYFFTAIFTMELTSKLIVYGLIFHQGAFLRAPANLLDFVVVGVSLVSMMPGAGNAVSTIKILRVARVLRPLRAVTRAKGLKRVITCMIVAIKTIGNIVIVTTLLDFMYAVIGVQLFKGAFFQCTDPSKKSYEQCHGTFITYEDGDKNKPILEEREWVNNPFNFDSVPNGMLTLFCVSTGAGWSEVMYLSIDSVGEDQAPVHDNRLGVVFFYISFLVIVSYFMLNVFVGFVIMVFCNEGEKEFEHCDMEKNQRDCISFAMKSKPVKKFIPKNPFQYKVWSIVYSEKFDLLSFGLIIANTVSLGMKFYNQPQWYTDLLDQANLFFTVAFTVEFVLKFVSLGLVVYCKDAWNVFDFFIVMGSYVDIIFAGVDIGVFKLFRVGRLIKLLNKSKGLRSILFTFIKSLQALPYVVLLILLLFFIYSIIGMQTFGKIALDGDTEIHRNNNFQTFGNTMLLLFRCATGEGWNEVMMACSGGDHVKCFFPPENATEPNICGSNASYPYYISFVVFCSFLVLNLFVAVIMDNFDYLTRDSSILGSHHLGEFIENWSNYDPDATGWINHHDVAKMLRRIDPPLGFGKMCPRRTACKKLVAMNMPMNEEGMVNFNATLFGLVRTGLQIRMEGNIAEANEDLRQTIMALWKDTDPAMLDLCVPPPTAVKSKNSSVGRFYAAILIQEMFRRFRKRKGIVKRE